MRQPQLDIFYQINAKIKVNDSYIAQKTEKMGFFVLASNDMTLSPEEILDKYKGQDRVEKGFRFLKSDTFRVSKIYLKSKKRIRALSMIMVLCLLIYSIAEWRLRERLKEEDESVPDQKGKPTKKPTMRWVFFIFRGIAELVTESNEVIEYEVLNMEEVHWKILNLLGVEYEKIYL